MQVPVPVIRLALQTASYHILGHIFFGIHHRTAITQEGKVFFPEGLRKVGAEGIAVCMQQHLIGPYSSLFAQQQTEAS